MIRQLIKRTTFSLFFISLLGLAIGCIDSASTHESTGSLARQIKYNRANFSLQSGTCIDTPNRCASIAFDIPFIETGETKVEQEVQRQMAIAYARLFPEAVAIELSSDPDPKKLAQQFLAAYDDYLRNNTSYNSPWNIKIEGEELFQNQNVTSLRLESTAALGDKGKVREIKLLTFDLSSGKQLGLKDFVTDLKAFQTLLGKQVQAQYGFDKELFRKDGIFLPQEVALIEGGVLLNFREGEINPDQEKDFLYLCSFDQIGPLLNTTWIKEANLQ